MKKSVVILLLLLTSILLFVAYTFISTGYFREINNTQGYEVIATYPFKGAEDLTISYKDDFMIVSQDDRAGRRDGNPSKGALYYIDLSDSTLAASNLTADIPLPFYPHGISLFRIDSSRYQILAVNHANGEAIEKFELIGDSLIHLQSIKDPSMVSVNDVVIFDEDRFYFTNDHRYTSRIGLLAENYLGIAVSNVVYFDGDSFREVAGGIAYANGINLSKDRSQLLVASPRKFKLLYYDIVPNGDLTLSSSLDVGTGIDNIELDESGNLWIGAHPNLLAFTAYAVGKKEMAPSELIRIDLDGSVESFFENDGSLFSATSVVAPYKDLLFVGTVMDDELVVIKKKGG